MYDIIEFTSRIKHRRIDRSPPPLLELVASGLAVRDRIVRHRHGVRFPSLCDPIERLAQVSSTLGRIVGVVREDFEQGLPYHLRSLGHRRVQIRIAYGDDFVVVRLDDEIVAGHVLEQSTKGRFSGVRFRLFAVINFANESDCFLCGLTRLEYVHPNVTTNPFPLGGLDGDLKDRAVGGGGRSQTVDFLADRRTVVSEKHGYVLSEQFRTCVPGCLEEGVVDRDEAILSVESIHAVVNRIDEAAIVLAGLDIVRLSPEGPFRSPVPFTHIHVEAFCPDKYRA